LTGELLHAHHKGRCCYPCVGRLSPDPWRPEEMTTNKAGIHEKLKMSTINSDS
jgi:hypothetical protein